MKIALLAAPILSLTFLCLSVRLFLHLSSMSVSLPLLFIEPHSFSVSLTHVQTHPVTRSLTHLHTHALAHTRTRTETHTHKQLMVIGAVCRTTDKLPCHLHTTNSRVISLYVCCFVVVVNKLLCHLHTTNSDELFLCVCVRVFIVNILLCHLHTTNSDISLCVLLL